MATKVRCKNCKLEFTTDDSSKLTRCPRCSAGKDKLDLQRDPLEAPKTSADPKKVVYSSSGIVYGDTKEAWKSFHRVESKACPKCGGTDFERDFKRKEKTCKKCGEIYPLARRFG